MAEKKVKRSLKRLKKIRTWQLALVLILLLFVAATLLRLDNIGMADRREAVLAADKNENREQLENRLMELKNYVFSHMNSSTDEFYLQYTYEKDAQAILEAARQAADAANPNGNVYKKASDYCDPLAQRFGWGYSAPYFNCITEQLMQYEAAGEVQDKVVLPNTELYRLSYVSPLWTPSWSGLVVAICVILSVVIIIKLFIYIILRIILLQYKND